MNLRDSKKLVLLALSAICITVLMPPSSQAAPLTLKAGEEVLVEFQGNGIVLIQGNKYAYKRLKKSKRLKIISKNGYEGVFIKRYGTKIRIRDLGGNILHLLLKARTYYKVKLGDGTELANIKIEKEKVLVTNRETGAVIQVVPGDGCTLFLDPNGTPILTLKGDARPFPAAFFALTPLTLLERTACYLMYR